MDVRRSVVGLVAVAVAGCRPSDVLSVPPPAGVLSSAALASQAGAESAFNGAKAELFNAADGSGFPGLGVWSGLLSDEFTLGDFGSGGYEANIDARQTKGGSAYGENGDYSWVYLLAGRSTLFAALPGLVKYEPSSGRSKVGEVYALAGYAELLIAEAYCAGTPLSEVVPNGPVRYGNPLTTDSLLGVAAEHFDSAAAAANGDPTIAALADVGLGRALLDRGRYAAAATAVQSVPTAFVYNAELPLTYTNGNGSGPALEEPNPYAYGYLFFYGRFFNVADREGGNGLNFVSAHDARLAFDTTDLTEDGGAPWRVPMKFKVNLSYVPLATGIEARLIAAEAALQASQVGTWLADLNALRNSGCTVSGTDTTCSIGTGQVPSQTTGMPSLSDPGTDSGRVSLMFRERAFWLFGTGTRLGDLRRLIRQYGRNAEQVFPTGPYAPTFQSHLPAPIPNYGTDVSLTLPTSAEVIYSVFLGGDPNPNYKGCITGTNTA